MKRKIEGLWNLSDLIDLNLYVVNLWSVIEFLVDRPNSLPICNSWSNESSKIPKSNFRKDRNLCSLLYLVSLRLSNEED